MQRALEKLGPDSLGEKQIVLGQPEFTHMLPTIGLPSSRQTDRSRWF